VAIDPARLTIGELIDIAQRSNPETRVCWSALARRGCGWSNGERLLPDLVAAAAGGYDRALFRFQRCALSNNAPTNGNLPNVEMSAAVLNTESLLARGS